MGGALGRLVWACLSAIAGCTGDYALAKSDGGSSPTSAGPGATEDNSITDGGVSIAEGGNNVEGGNAPGRVDCTPTCAAVACGVDDGCGGRCPGSCPSGLHCEDGRCTCDARSCNGCCASETCQTGTSDTECGELAAACVACSADRTCHRGQCKLWRRVCERTTAFGGTTTSCGALCERAGLVCADGYGGRPGVYGTLFDDELNIDCREEGTRVEVDSCDRRIDVDIMRSIACKCRAP
jgi:hypothetical protein